MSFFSRVHGFISLLFLGLCTPILHAQSHSSCTDAFFKIQPTDQCGFQEFSFFGSQDELWVTFEATDYELELISTSTFNSATLNYVLLFSGSCSNLTLEDSIAIGTYPDTAALSNLSIGSNYILCFNRDLVADCPSGCPDQGAISICIKNRSQEEGIFWDNGGQNGECNDFVDETNELVCDVFVCVNQPLELEAGFTDNGVFTSFPTAVNWLLPGSTTPVVTLAQGAINAIWTAPGTYTCSWEDPANNSLVVFNVQVIDVPVSNLSFDLSDDQLCPGEFLDVLNISSNGPGVTYIIDVSPALPIGVSINGTNIGPMQSTMLGQTYSVIVTAQNACSSVSESMDFTVDYDLTFEASVKCTQVSVTPTSECDANWTYSWDWGDGNISLFTQGTQSHTYTSPGSYVITMTANTPSSQVVGSAFQNVNVIGEPIPSFSYSVNCGVIQIMNETECDDFITDWLWDFGDGGTSNLQNPSPYTYSQNGTYTVTLTATTIDGSTYTFQDVITINEAPALIEILGPERLCCDDLTFTVDPGFVSYNWSFGPNGNCVGCTLLNNGTNAVTVVPSDPEADILEICVTAIDDNGCEVSDCYWLTDAGCCEDKFYVDPEEGANSGDVLASDVRVFTDYCEAEFLSNIVDVLGNPVTGNYNAQGDYIVINHDLIVDVDVNFINARIRVLPEREIFVQAGITMELNNSSIEAVCQESMWKGITLSFPSSEFIANNALIKHAEAALTSNFASNYTITNSEFSNNWVGILVNETTTAHPGTVTSTEFNTDNTFIFSLFPPFDSEQRSFAGIQSDRVEDLTVGQPGGPVNRFDALQYGIYAFETNLTVNRNIFEDIVDPSGNNNSGRYKGIYAFTRVNSVNLTVGGTSNAQANLFRNVNVGIHTRGRVNTLIERNTVNELQLYGFWIELNNLSGNSHIVRNNFINTGQGSVGIFARDNFDATVDIERNRINSFTDRLNTGILISQTAAPPSNLPLIQVNSNFVRQCNFGIAALNTPNIEIDLNTVQVSVSNNDLVPGNGFAGILIFNCQNGDITRNILTRSGGTPNNVVEDDFLTGIFVENSAQAFVLNNTVSRYGRGIWASDANPNSLYYCNLLTNNWSGFYFSNAVIGNQGLPPIPFLPNGLASDNRWFQNQGQWRIDGDLSLPIDWYHRPGAVRDPNPIEPAVLASFINDQVLNNNAASFCNFGGGPFNPGPIRRQLLFERAVTGTNAFTNDSTDFRYWEMVATYKAFEADSTWLAQDPSDDVLYQNFHAMHDAGNCGTYTKGELAFARRDTAMVITHCTAALPNCLHEQNMHDVYTLCADKYLTDDVTLSAADSVWLYNLACADPLLEGPAVYSARSQLGLPLICLNNGNLRSAPFTTPESVNEEFANVTLYPNPTTGRISIVSSKSVNLIKVYDSTGKRVLTFNTQEEQNITVDLSALESGIYIIEVQGDNYRKVEKLLKH